MKVAVTGATGFLGSALCRAWPKLGCDILSISRDQCRFDQAFDLRDMLSGIDVVVHTAARAHVIREPADHAIMHYRMTNVLGTQRLCRQAVQAGVKRFVLISSIGVLGSNTNHRSAFTCQDQANPSAAYAASKWEAEQTVTSICSNSAMEAVIVRPPLICGPGAKGNLFRLMRMVDLGLPLPLAGLTNRRSFVSLENLVDLLFLCCYHPDAPAQPWLVADQLSMTPPSILEQLAIGLGRSSHLFSLPKTVLSLGSRLFNRHAAWQQLSANLEVDSSATARMLGWQPALDSHDALLAMATTYRALTQQA